MAGRQSRAAALRPLIGSSLEDVPVAKLPSQKDVLRVIAHYRQQIGCQKKPVSTFTCDVKRDKTASCNDADGGCVARGERCLLYKVKKIWIQAGLYTVTDSRIIEKLIKIQEKYNEIIRHLKRKTKKEEDNRNEFLEIIEKTFDISDPNCRLAIVNDKNRSEQAKEDDLKFFDDYIGKLEVQVIIYLSAKLIASL